MFGVKGLIFIVAFVLLFGGAFYDVTVTGGRCVLAVTNPELGYGCGDLWSTLGAAIIMPDRNIATGVQGVIAIQNASDETLNEIGMLKGPGTVRFQQTIILGVIGFFVLLGFFAYVFIKLSPASGIDAGSLAVSVLAAVLLMAAISAVFDDTPEHGNMAFFGERTPFKGIRLLIANPDVLGSVIDETGIMPGTLTVDDITENQSLGDIT